MIEIYSGFVVFFSNNLNYGFLQWEMKGVKQPDLFVHWSDINVPGFKTLKKDSIVTFEIGRNIKNQPKAINVTPVPIER